MDLDSDLSKDLFEYSSDVSADIMLKKNFISISNNKSEPVMNIFSNDSQQLEKLFKNPDYGTILDYIEKFSKFLSFKSFKINTFETDIADSSKSVNKTLINLHLELIKASSTCKKTTLTENKWERYLVKFLEKYSYEDSQKLEKNEYINCDIDFKIKIVKDLLECQFDENQRFRSALQNNLEDVEWLRSRPFGRDTKGYDYWFFIDSEYTFRLFKNYYDDDTYKTWELIARKPFELNEIIKNLSIDLEKFKKEKMEQINLNIENEKSKIKEKSNNKKTRLRSRNKRKKMKEDTDNGDESDTSTMSNASDEQTKCSDCLKFKSLKILILCDGCDSSYHLDCLKPPLDEVPVDNWYCTVCQHEKLIQNLKDKLKEVEMSEYMIEKTETKVDQPFALTKQVLKEKKESITQDEKLKKMDTKSVKRLRSGRLTTSVNYNLSEMSASDSEIDESDDSVSLSGYESDFNEDDDDIEQLRNTIHKKNSNGDSDSSHNQIQSIKKPVFKKIKRNPDEFNSFYKTRVNSRILFGAPNRFNQRYKSHVKNNDEVEFITYDEVFKDEQLC